MDRPEGKMVISGSQVDDFNKCEFRHFVVHGLKLVPKKLSDPLQIGIAGHDVIANFFKRTLQGESFSSAAWNCFELLDSFDFFESKNRSEVDRILYPYLNYYKNAPWEVLAVEETYYWEVPGHDYVFGMRLDQLLRYTDGKYTGQTAILDWKFTNNFWSFWQFRMYVQLKRYEYILQQLGQKIDRRVVAQIRYRTNAREIFKHEHEEPVEQLELDLIMRETTRTMDRIYRLRQMPLVDWKKNVRRAVNSENCRYCPVASLCALDLKGKDFTVEAALYYGKNTYGYDQSSVS